MKRFINNLYLHVFLFAVFPTLSLYSHNIRESWPNIIIFPFIYSIIFALFSYLLFLIIFRDKTKSGIFTSVWLLLFFSYGHIYLYLASLNVSKILPFGLNTLLLGFYLIIFLILFLLLIINKIKLKETNQLLNFIAITLVLINLITIVPFEIRRVNALYKLNKYLKKDNIKLTSNVNKDNLPDIYYFIFDRYANEKVLNEYFNFDNSETINFLQNKGFYISNDSFANYPFTFLSLSSSLNMDYLNYLKDILGENYSDQSIIYSEFLQNNKIVKFFKNIGYEYIHIGDGWPGTKFNINADKNFNTFISYDDFQIYLYENTLLNTVLEKIASKRIYAGVERLYKKIENLNFRINKVKEIIPLYSPKFVFVHFLFPHPPYLVSQNCKSIDFKIIRKTKEEISYIKQLKCVNKLIKDFVNEILNKSKRKSIIIIQSDEGPFLPNDYFKNEKYLKNKGEDPYIIHGKILNAFYFPDKNTNNIVNYNNLNISEFSTPVNTFRYIFNYYFGTNLKILEDKSYIYEDNKYPYKFVEVTEKMK